MMKTNFFCSRLKGGGILSVKLTYHETVAIKYRMAQKRLLSLLMVEHGTKLHVADGREASTNGMVSGKSTAKQDEQAQQKSMKQKQTLLMSGLQPLMLQ